MNWAFLLDSVPFSKRTILGETSLGGSESACLGLARALQARGHSVHVFTTKLDPDCNGGLDKAGVTWHDLSDFHAMNQFIEWDVVCALRMIMAYAWRPVYARLRLLWSQDLLVPGPMQASTMAIAWALDHLCYVSEYHRRQWEQLQPELTPLGWVTRNGFSPADLPKETVVKDPNRIIHISRPERGLGPTLGMWPMLKKLRPEATLQVCRYSSMYDTGPGSWSDECARWDRLLQSCNAEHGGITYLGELNKPQLYQAISEAAVMWYPGVAGFAETNCIAALEAEACGTPFVGSYRGALPETSPTGTLIKGDAAEESYHTASVAAVAGLMDGCKTSSFGYRKTQKAGRLHAEGATFDVLAAQWEAQVEAWFRERYESRTLGVLRQLLHEDDHVAAHLVAGQMIQREMKLTVEQSSAGAARPEALAEATTALEFCEFVMAGKDQTSEQYGAAAIPDPLKEVEASDRFRAVVPHFEKSTNVLDVACGNGSFAIALAKAHPKVRVLGLDYSQANIDRAEEAAERAGVLDRCTFLCRTVYDFERHELHDDWSRWAALQQSDEITPFDGLFVGEFIEHVANYHGVIEGLEAVLAEGAQVVYTCPHGACAELVPRHMPLHRGHVSRFHHDDVHAVWGKKKGFAVQYLDAGFTERGNPIGNWLIAYQKSAGQVAGRRQLEARAQRTRPLQRISVGILAKDCENELGRCLASVYGLADEVLVGDTGSSDGTMKILASYGERLKTFALEPILDQPEGFAGARNQLLRKASGDWFLWIDTDEALLNGPWLRRYLDGAIYQGFVLPQRHLYLDGPPTDDIPVRLFRNTGRIRFYGCIHEQPQDGEPNADIHPTLKPEDCVIAHLGYLTEEGREEKRVERNLPLLLRDRAVFPDRLLGKVLLLREACIQADHERAHHRGQMTERAQQGYAHCVQLFTEFFDDPGHKYHQIARPWYEASLQHLGHGWEEEVAICGRFGGLGTPRQVAKLERVWVRDGEEFRRLMAHKVEQVVASMAPTTFLTDPDDTQLVGQPTAEADEPLRLTLGEEREEATS